VKILITDGVGTGPTRLAAFDAALQIAGIGDFNLIELSSIVPNGSEIIIKNTLLFPKISDADFMLY